MLQKFRAISAAVFVTAFYWLYSRFWRVERVRAPGPRGADDAPRMYAHWHGDELLLVGSHVGSGMAVMASRSRDGELMGRMLRWLGYHVVRGSSSRGGAGGLKGLVDAVRKERRDASLAVDGPRGPIYEVKPGILKLAQQTGCVLIPGAGAAARRFIFKKAWNQCYLPFPFSKCVIVHGEPMRVPEGITDEEFERLRNQLERRLKALKVEAENHFVRKAGAMHPALLQRSGNIGA